MRQATLANAFVENFFPSPPAELLFCALMLRKPTDRWRFTLLTVVFSTLGALAGYAIGALAYGYLRQNFEGLASFDAHIAAMQDAPWASFGILALSLSVHLPPLKIACIGSGVAGMHLLPFMVINIVVRGVKYWWLDQLLLQHGGKVLVVLTRYKRGLAAALVVALVGALVVFGLS